MLWHRMLWYSILRCNLLWYYTLQYNWLWYNKSFHDTSWNNRNLLGQCDFRGFIFFLVILAALWVVYGYLLKTMKNENSEKSKIDWSRMSRCRVVEMTRKLRSKGRSESRRVVQCRINDYIWDCRVVRDMRTLLAFHCIISYRITLYCTSHCIDIITSSRIMLHITTLEHITLCHTSFLYIKSRMTSQRHITLHHLVC